MQTVNTNHRIFLGKPLATYDSLNVHYPKIFELYKKQKAQDWSEDEFPLEQSRLDFETVPESMSGVMLEILKWQWEADSQVAKSLAVAFAPFITDDTYATAILKQSEIEKLHALTYSEIVRQCIRNPETILDEIQNNAAVQDRMRVINKVLEELLDEGINYRLNFVREQLLERDPLHFHKVILKALFAVAALEGIAFMASFACTFALDAQDKFQGIAQAVQKIMLDEILHTQIDIEVLKETLKDPEFQTAFQQVLPEIKVILDEGIESEEKFSYYIFSDGRAIVGLNSTLLKSWVYYNAAPLYDMFGIPRDFEAPKEAPLKYMLKKMEIDKEQNANQEQQNGAYLINTVVDDLQSGYLEV